MARKNCSTVAGCSPGATVGCLNGSFECQQNETVLAGYTCARYHTGVEKLLCGYIYFGGFHDMSA